MTTAARSRRREILALLTEGDPRTSLVERVCEVSARLLGVSGAGMCLVGGSRQQIIVHGTDPMIEELEDLQVTLGQGPCIEAVKSGTPVLVPELEGYRTATWQQFADHALQSGVKALFAFPLHSGTIQLGALDLYRLEAGPLTDEQAADALILTQIANRSMLAQKDKIHLDGSVSALHWISAASETQTPGAQPDPPGRAVDLGITVGQALAPNWPDGGNDALGPRPDSDDGL